MRIPEGFREDMIVLQLVKENTITYSLENTPYREYLDMFVICRYIMGKNGDKIALASITKDVLQEFDMTEDELFDLAKRNTLRLLNRQPQIMSIKGFVEDLEEDIKEVISDMIDLSQIRDIWIITNNKRFFGANILLYEPKLKILEKIAEQADSNLLVSLHDTNEMYVASERDYHIYRFLKIHDEAMQIIPTADRLSGNVYRYHKDLKKISVIFRNPIIL